MSKEIVINASGNETRVAVVESNQLTEIFIERKGASTFIGNIYKGKVDRVLPGMQSAFINIDLERDAFLYVDDVYEDLSEYEHFFSMEEGGGEVKESGRRMRNGSDSIENLLKDGQEILVQVTRDPIGTKGARISSHITLPGKYLVYMPTVAHTGVSKKIEDEEEREKLKEIVLRLKRDNGGYIIRTAGQGKGEGEFLLDMDYLREQWEGINRKFESTSSPALIHRDLNLALKVLRDVLDDDFNTILVDNEELYHECVDFLSRFHPDFNGIIKLYTDSYPIFEEYGIEGEIEKALRNKVWLKSGGYIIINQMEALVSIDINTGKYVGKNTLEETVLKTNLEAVREIARQIRLRDLAGIIVIDFIDMGLPENRQTVIKTLQEELKKDRAKMNILQMSDFGLVEITRQRTKKSLENILSQSCPYCYGSGKIKNVVTVCHEIEREVIKIASRLCGGEILIRAHPEVTFLLRERLSMIREMERSFGVKIEVASEEKFHHEQYDIHNL